MQLTPSISAPLGPTRPRQRRPITSKSSRNHELFIGGKWVQPQSKKYFDTVSPSTEQKLAEVAEAGDKDVDLAVQAARAGYEKYWSKLRPIERGKYIFRISRAIQEKARELAIDREPRRR